MPWFRRKKKRRTFKLEVNPVVGHIAPGKSASASIVVKRSDSEVASVSLLAGTTPEGGGLPAGLNVSFNPPLGVSPFTSVMNISTSPELASGVYSFLVIGAGEDMRQLVTYTLIVRSGKSASGKSAPETGRPPK